MFVASLGGMNKTTKMKMILVGMAALAAAATTGAVAQGAVAPDYASLADGAKTAVALDEVPKPAAKKPERLGGPAVPEAENGAIEGVPVTTLEAIAACESGGDPTAVNAAGYYGKYQFDESTWASVGGSGNPAEASEAEQDYRAALLYSRAGSSPWPLCGQ